MLSGAFLAYVTIYSNIKLVITLLMEQTHLVE